MDTVKFNDLEALFGNLTPQAAQLAGGPEIYGIMQARAAGANPPAWGVADLALEPGLGRDVVQFRGQDGGGGRPVLKTVRVKLGSDKYLRLRDNA